MKFFPLLLCAFFWIDAIPVNGQVTLLGVEELHQKPLYFQLERALEHPEKVYRLYLDKFQHEWEDARQLLPSLINLQSVVIVGDFFQELPEELLSFKFQLQEIIFQENARLDIAAVCRQLKEFPYLHKLGFVQMNGLNYPIGTTWEIPAEMSELQQVKYLDLSLNPLYTLPAPLLQMRQLQIIDLSSTELDSIPKQIAQLRVLTHLLLGCHPDGRPNPLTTLPTTIGKLQELRVLNLFQCEKLAELPPSIAKLKYIEELNIGDCSALDAKATFDLVTSIPTLKKLNLSHLQVGKLLPKTISKLRMLEWLNLYSCGIQELPEEMTNLGRLGYINLRSNRVNSIEQKKWKERFDKIEF